MSMYPSQLQLSWSLPPLPDAQTKMEPLPFLHAGKQIIIIISFKKVEFEFTPLTCPLQSPAGTPWTPVCLGRPPSCRRRQGPNWGGGAIFEFAFIFPHLYRHNAQTVCFSPGRIDADVVAVEPDWPGTRIKKLKHQLKSPTLYLLENRGRIFFLLPHFFPGEAGKNSVYNRLFLPPPSLGRPEGDCKILIKSSNKSCGSCVRAFFPGFACPQIITRLTVYQAKQNNSYS